jgi:hypothetical protein
MLDAIQMICQVGLQSVASLKRSGRFLLAVWMIIVDSSFWAWFSGNSYESPIASTGHCSGK